MINTYTRSERERGCAVAEVSNASGTFAIMAYGIEHTDGTSSFKVYAVKGDMEELIAEYPSVELQKGVKP